MLIPTPPTHFSLSHCHQNGPCFCVSARTSRKFQLHPPSLILFQFLMKNWKISSAWSEIYISSVVLVQYLCSNFQLYEVKLAVKFWVALKKFQENNI